MSIELKDVSHNMKELGLAALSNANRIDASIEKWEELAVLQVAHAAEILVKARIAEEHPLLIFEKFPSKKDGKLSLQSLYDEGHTVEWSKLLDLLWATTDIDFTTKGKEKIFKDFGKIRNSIQHFGAMSLAERRGTSGNLEAIKFIYGFIDPFIYKCWGYYATDYSQDYNPEEDDDYNRKYWDFIKSLVDKQIEFMVSKRVASKCEIWFDPLLEEMSPRYMNIMRKKIEKFNPPIIN